jgi:Skp family chaperone for outer membrane proteins
MPLILLKNMELKFYICTLLKKKLIMIKTYILGFVVTAFTLVSCGGSDDSTDGNNAEAQKPAVNNQSTTIPSSGVRIAFIHMDTINLKYKAIASMQDELAAKEKEYQARIETVQRQAQAWNKKWQDKGIMSSEQEKYMLEGQQWEQKMAQAQQDAQVGLGQFQAQQAETLARRLNFILQEYANENGIDFILTYQLGGQVGAVNPAYNVTSAIIEKLNADYDKNAAVALD